MSRNRVSRPSLIRRLCLASALILPLTMGFSAYTLNRAYVNSLDSAEFDALEAQIYALISVAEPYDNALSLPEVMSNPRFETPESGLYARILNEHGYTIWQSNSLESASFTIPSRPHPPKAGAYIDRTLTSQEIPHRSMLFGTVWEIQQRDTPFTFEVIHSQMGKLKETRAYQKALFFWLGGMILLLIALQIFIVRWGLKPLSLLASEISDVEQGTRRELTGAYPAEIEPVTHSLNKLLESESSQRERYKNALADLTHSLKTPLSVIRAQLESNREKDQIVDEQIERMSSIISHHLKRASAQVKALYGAQIELHPLLTRLQNALIKVYADKHIDIKLNIDEAMHVAIENDDAMEVFGNIIENACKYGKKRVVISSNTKENTLQIHIDDDGTGIEPSLRKEILQRGARADTREAGQGIGLAIAVDILKSYDADLTIEQADLGGARFTLNLPLNG